MLFILFQGRIQVNTRLKSCETSIFLYTFHTVVLNYLMKLLSCKTPHNTTLPSWDTICFINRNRFYLYVCILHHIKSNHFKYNMMLLQENSTHHHVFVTRQKMKSFHTNDFHHITRELVVSNHVMAYGFVCTKRKSSPITRVSWRESVTSVYRSIRG